MHKYTYIHIYIPFSAIPKTDVKDILVPFHRRGNRFRKLAS